MIVLKLRSLIIIRLTAAADCTVIAGTSTAAVAIDVATVIAAFVVIAFVVIASAVIRAS